MNVKAQALHSNNPAQSLTPKPGVLLQHKCASGGTAGLNGQCAECDKERLTLQRDAANQPASSTLPSISPIVDEVLRSPDLSLEGDTHAFMESRFGYDFSQVRVHADARATDPARAIKASAYTVGKDGIVQARLYRPETEAGKSLLVHELRQIVQQGGAGLDPMRSNHG